MNITVDPLAMFYLAGAIAMLAFAIVVYPTLRERSKKRKH